MKLAEWARRQGIDYRTAWKWFHAGILPVPSRQLPTGTILVDVDLRETVESRLTEEVKTLRAELAELKQNK